MAQSDAHLTDDQEVTGLIPIGSMECSVVGIDHGIFSMVILFLPLIRSKKVGKFCFCQKNMHKYWLTA